MVHREICHALSKSSLKLMTCVEPSSDFGTATLPLVAPLIVESPGDTHCPQPITVGLPLPRGALTWPACLALHDDSGVSRPVQAQPLNHWSDGSIRWLLVDFVAPPLKNGLNYFRLVHTEPSECIGKAKCIVSKMYRGFNLDTGLVAVRTGDLPGSLFQIDFAGQPVFSNGGAGVLLTVAKGRQYPASIDHIDYETTGPIRATIRLSGRFAGNVPCRFVCRLDAFAGTGLLRVRLTIHNPLRARHRGGLWDLGDQGSILFRDLSLLWTLADRQGTRANWQTEIDGPVGEGQAVDIYQDSSGGTNWHSENHLNRVGQVPCSFRGYRLIADGKENHGLRASPQLIATNSKVAIGVSVPEFWQQFPKAISFANAAVHVGLFPRQFADQHELQGGEQKTHTIWMRVGSPDSGMEALEWVHRPALARSTPQWYALSGVIRHLAPSEPNQTKRLDSYLAPSIDGDDSFVAGREVIDEYGWRNYGEIWANHEGAYCSTPPPVISHYNNQYDSIYGTLLQYFRTGDSRWWGVADPLARHVADIDIYHTTEDKSAYNGGLFWFTDHYKDAATSTHRTYSRANVPSDGKPYGGGPGSAHNFTSGLTTYYFLTGDHVVRDVALSLADWVMAMDDGANNVLGLIDDGPTGLASYTADPDYHGPGRGPGLSINALLDGWILTDQRAYLEKAEHLIRRVVHPLDDIGARDLLNVELRWSYCIFLSSVVRYLDIKAELGEVDTEYFYARSSLLHYAAWMVENELPYLDQKEKLEFPTETWPAQELRKANVLRLASAFADEPLRSQLISRGQVLSDRAWSDLLTFSSKHVARALAIVMVEGTYDDWLRRNNPESTRCPEFVEEFDSPSLFVTQKRRIINRLKSPTKWPAILLRLVRPSVWQRRTPRQHSR